MQDKAKLGSRYTCYQCACKFYDLNRPVPSCPECSSDQREAPIRDMKALLKSGKKKLRANPDDDAKFATDEAESESSSDDDDDGLGLLGGDDDGDDDDDDDDDASAAGGDDDMD